MLRKGLVVVVMSVLLLASVAPPLFAQEQQENPIRIGPCGSDCNPNSGGGPVPPKNLSLAVAKTLQSKMLTLNNKLQAHQASSADYAAAATAAQAYFSNSDEVGWTGILQSWILNNSSLFTTVSPTQAQLKAGYATLTNAGAVVTYNQYVQEITGDPLADREAFLSFVQTYGLSAVHTEIVSQLNVMSAQVATRHNGGIILHANKWTFTWGAVGLYLGIVGLACTGPVGVAIAIAGLGCAGVGLLGE